MAAGPGDEKAASAVGRGHLRASHADREQVMGTLKAAFIQGRLAKDEFDLRVGQALASRTYAELAAITADLPAGLASAQPPQPAPVPGVRPIWRRPGMMATVATVLYAGMWPVAVVLPGNGEDESQSGLNLVGVATFVYLLVLILAFVLAQAPASRREKRPGGQLPGRPAQSGQTLEGERDRGPGNDLILCQAHRDTRAHRRLGHRVTQRIWRSVPTRRANAGLCT